MAIRGLMTSSELIEAVKRRAFLPNTQDTLSDQDILDYLNEELADSVLPVIMAMHDEFLLYSDVVTIEPNKSSYKIPYRAVGRKLRDIKYVDTQGNRFTMSRVDVTDRSMYQGTATSNFQTFYLMGDEIHLTSNVGSNPNGSIEFIYYIKPNDLVEESRVGRIVDIDTNTGVIELDAIPTNLTIGSLIDMLEFRPGNRTLNFDIAIIDVDTANKTITVDASDIPSSLSLGDVIASAQECIIPQIPPEMHSILAERAAARCLASLGDQNALQASNQKISELEVKAGALIDNRTEGSPIKANNMRSILKQSRISRRRRFTP